MPDFIIPPYRIDELLKEEEKRRLPEQPPQPTISHDIPHIPTGEDSRNDRNKDQGRRGVEIIDM